MKQLLALFALLMLLLQSSSWAMAANNITLQRDQGNDLPRPVDIVLLNDSSDSTATTDPDGLRVRAATFLLDYVLAAGQTSGLNHRFAVTNFNIDVFDVRPLALLQADAIRQSLITKSEGWTDFVPPFRFALNELRGSFNSERNMVVVLFTDGRPELPDANNQPQSIDQAQYFAGLTSILDELQTAGVQVFVVAMGDSDDDRRLWTAPGRIPANHYRSIDNTTDLADVYHSFLADILGLQTTDAQQLASDETFSTTLPPYLEQVVFSVMKENTSVVTRLREPSGAIIPPSQGTADDLHEIYVIPTPRSGWWQLEIANGSAQLWVDQRYPLLSLRADSQPVALGSDLEVTAQLLRSNEPIIDNSLQIHLAITAPTGIQTSQEMRSGGYGLYTANLADSLTASGTYSLTAKAQLSGTDLTVRTAPTAVSAFPVPQVEMFDVIGEPIVSQPVTITVKLLNADVLPPDSTIPVHVRVSGGNLVGSIELHDDGQPPDEIADDGQFTALSSFPTVPGTYAFEMRLEGQTINGVPFDLRPRISGLVVKTTPLIPTKLSATSTPNSTPFVTVTPTVATVTVTPISGEEGEGNTTVNFFWLFVGLFSGAAMLSVVGLWRLQVWQRNEASDKDAIHQQLRQTEQSNEDLAAQVEALTQEKEDFTTREKSLTQEKEELAAQVEALTQEKEDFTTREKSLTQEKEELVAQEKKLTQSIKKLEKQNSWDEINKLSGDIDDALQEGNVSLAKNLYGAFIEKVRTKVEGMTDTARSKVLHVQRAIFPELKKRSEEKYWDFMIQRLKENDPYEIGPLVGTLENDWAESSIMFLHELYDWLLAKGCPLTIIANIANVTNAGSSQIKLFAEKLDRAQQSPTAENLQNFINYARNRNNLRANGLISLYEVLQKLTESPAFFAPRKEFEKALSKLNQSGPYILLEICEQAQRSFSLPNSLSESQDDINWEAVCLDLEKRKNSWEQLKEGKWRQIPEAHLFYDQLVSWYTRAKTLADYHSPIAPTRIEMQLSPTLLTDVIEETAAPFEKDRRKLMLPVALYNLGDLAAGEVAMRVENSQPNIHVGKGELMSVKGIDAKGVDRRIYQISYTYRGEESIRISGHYQEVSAFGQKQTSLGVLSITLSPPEELRELLSSNPFVPDMPRDPHEESKLPGHNQTVLEGLVRELTKASRGRMIALYGIRRTGKTSILLRVQYNPDIRQKFLPVNVDLLVWESLARSSGNPFIVDHFWYSLANEISKALQKVNVFGGIKDNLTYPSTDQKMGFDDFRSWWLKVSDVISPVRLLLLFDEADSLAEGWLHEDVLVGISAGLRSLTREHDVAIVMAHSWTDSAWVKYIYADRESEDSFLYPSPKQTAFLERFEVDILMETHFMLTDLAKEYLWRVTGGYPALVQLVGYVLYDNLTQQSNNGQYNSIVDIRDIKQVVAQILTAPYLSPFVAYLYYGFSQPDMKLLVALIKSGCIDPDTGRIDLPDKTKQAKKSPFMLEGGLMAKESERLLGLLCQECDCGDYRIGFELLQAKRIIEPDLLGYTHATGKIPLRLRVGMFYLAIKQQPNECVPAGERSDENLKGG